MGQRVILFTLTFHNYNYKVNKHNMGLNNTNHYLHISSNFARILFSEHTTEDTLSEHQEPLKISKQNDVFLVYNQITGAKYEPNASSST